MNISFTAFLAVISTLCLGVACAAHTSPQTPSNTILEAVQGLDSVCQVCTVQEPTEAQRINELLERATVEIVHNEVEINGVTQNS